MNHNIFLIVFVNDLKSGLLLHSDSIVFFSLGAQVSAHQIFCCLVYQLIQRHKNDIRTLYTLLSDLPYFIKYFSFCVILYKR